MRNPYRELFAIPGAGRFVVAGFVGRMPMAMSGIGVVLLVSAIKHSYGIAGAVSATTALAYAAASPVVGRLADRHGQGRVLLPLVIGNAVSVLTLILIAQFVPATWALFPAAAAVGGTSPSLGALVRARWAYLAGPRRLHLAYSFESVADEMIFVSGPMIVTLLATGVHPAAGIGASGLLALAGGTALALQRGSQPPPHPHGSGPRGSAIGSSGLRTMIPIFLLTGSTFGAIDVAVVAYAGEHGHRALAGPILAAFAVGSMLAGLWYGARHWRKPMDRRFVVGLGLLATGLAPLPFATSPWALFPLVFVTGLAISPTVIPAYGLVERLMPAHQLTEGLTWVSTSIGVGVAIGTSVAGRLADAYGGSTALVYPLGASWLALGVGLAGAHRFRVEAES